LALGVILVVTLAGGIPSETRAQWPILPKIVAGFLFPVGIGFVSLFGGELFASNSMSMLFGLMSRRVRPVELFCNWTVVLVSNFVGAVLTVFFFGYLTEFHQSEPWLSYIQEIAVRKVNMKPHVAFLRAIPANALVCTCILLGLSARDMMGKLVSLIQ
jgi:formate/nitrite transporter FocA (FNT family)